MKRPDYEGTGATSVEWFPSQNHLVHEVQLVCCYCYPHQRVVAVYLDEGLAHPCCPVQIVTTTLHNAWIPHTSTIVTLIRAELIKVRSNQSLAAAASLSVLKPMKANRRDVPSGLRAILKSVMVPGGAPRCSKCFRRRSAVKLGGRFFTMRRDIEVECKLLQYKNEPLQLRPEHAATPATCDKSNLQCPPSNAMASTSIFGQEKNPRGIPKAPFIVSGR